MKYVE